MAKLLVLLCIALFAMTLVMGCKPPGFLCSEDSDCCATLVCNPWAGRCVKAPVPPAGGAEVPPDDGEQ